jgi:hypothetical protein
MKLIYTLIFALLVCENIFSQDNYISVGISSNSCTSMYFNKNIRKNLELKNTYYVWVKWVKHNEDKDSTIAYLKRIKSDGESVGDCNSFDYETALFMVNIQSYKVRWLSDIFYSSNGTIIYSNDENENKTDWSYVVPESLMETLIKKVHKYLIRK